MDRAKSDELEAGGTIKLGGNTLDLHRGELRDGAGRQVSLRKQALEVLLLLGNRAGHIVTRDELTRHVWPGVVVTEDSLVQAIADIRRALDDHDRTLVRTLPRRGYMLMPELPVDPLVPRSFAGVGVWAVAALVLAGVAAWIWTRPLPTPTPPQVAVLAFQERGSGNDAAPLGTGLAEDLTLELGRNQGLNVVAHQSSFAVSGKGLPAAELGRMLHAQYLIDGVVRREGERVDLEIELIDARADKILWVERRQSEGGAITHARDAIVNRVAGTLLSGVRAQEKQRAVRASPKSLDVYVLTQRGLALKHQFTPQATREGRAALQRAITLDPDYGPAWWALGYLNALDAHLGLSGEWNHARMHEAVTQVERGIALDPHSSMAYQALKCAFGTEGRERDALAASQRAVELGPGDAEAWLFQADSVLLVNHASEAVPSMQRALEMDPLPPVYFDAIHAKVLWGNGQTQAALQKAQDCLRRAPLFSVCRFVELLAYAKSGQLDKARADIPALDSAPTLRAHGCGMWGGTPAVVEECHRLTQAVHLPG